MDNKPNYYINATNALSYPFADDLIAGEMGLYITIVLKFNRFGWKKKVVGIKNIELIAKTGISEKTLDKYRQNLVDIGLLKVRKGSRGRATEYQLPYSEINNTIFSSLNSSLDSSNEGIDCNNNPTNSSLDSSYYEDEQENNPTNSSSNSSNKEIDRNNNPTNSSLNSSTHKIEDKRYLYNKHHEDFENENFEKSTENENSEIPVKTEISSPKKVALKKGSPKTVLKKNPRVAKTKKQTFNEEQQEFWDLQIDQMPKPHNSDELQEVWNRYRELKKQSGKPLAPIQAEQQLKQLEKMDLQVAITQTEKAIAGDWTQIFPPFPNQTTKNNTQNTKPDFINADYSRITLK